MGPVHVLGVVGVMDGWRGLKLKISREGKSFARLLVDAETGMMKETQQQKTNTQN